MSEGNLTIAWQHAKSEKDIPEVQTGCDHFNFHFAGGGATASCLPEGKGRKIPGLAQLGAKRSGLAILRQRRSLISDGNADIQRRKTSHVSLAFAEGNLLFAVAAPQLVGEHADLGLGSHSA